MTVAQKTKSRITCDPVILLTDIHAKELKTGFHRDICTSVLMAALFTIIKT